MSRESFTPGISSNGRVMPVSITPGATALIRTPDFIHSAAFIRTQKAIANLPAGYATKAAGELKRATTDSSSCCRYAMASSTDKPGVIVVEFEEIMTTAEFVPFSSAGRRPLTMAKVP